MGGRFGEEEIILKQGLHKSLIPKSNSKLSDLRKSIGHSVGHGVESCTESSSSMNKKHQCQITDFFKKSQACISEENPIVFNSC